MAEHPISTIQEKIVGIEAVFSTLGSGEQENAVGLLEEYLKKLREQIKPAELSAQSTSEPPPTKEENVPVKRKTAAKKDDATPSKTKKYQAQKETEKKVTRTQSTRKQKVRPPVDKPVEEIKISSRGRKTRLRQSFAESDYEDNGVDLDVKPERTSKPKGGSRRGRPPGSGKAKQAVKTADSSSATLVANVPDGDAAAKMLLPRRGRKRRKMMSTSVKDSKKKRIYVQKKTFVCKACGEKFHHYKSMAVHLRTHGANPMSCRHCRSELINEIELLHHDCLEAPKDKYTCPSCGEKFSKKKLCRIHLYERHNLKYNKVLGKGSNNVCRFCNRSFVRKVSLFMHYKVHAETSFVCLKCGEICEDFTKYTDHMQLHDKAASFDCDKCGASFERQQQYQQHLVGHRKYDCSDCDMCFTRNKELMRHRRAVHGDIHEPEPKKFECLICGKKFHRPMQLEIHTRIHTGERPLECTTCQLSFRTSKALAKHKQTYNHCLKAGLATQEKKYLCSECGKAYFRKQALQRHIRYHTGDKPHTCQYCGYKCREQNNLKRHIALHFENLRNFICEVCGAAFHAKKTLEMHFKYKHTEIRDYSCPECPMSFKAKNALKRHVKTHEKTKDHKCWCGSAFGRMYNLRRHMRMVHGDEESLPPVRKVAVLDAADAIKQAVKSPPAKKRMCKPKHIQPLPVKSEHETIIMNVVQESVAVDAAHTQTMYSIPPQHPQVTAHMADEQQQQQQQQQHNMVYDTVAIPPSMVAYHHNAPPAPPIGAETVVDNRTQQQQQQQQQQHAADYYNNPSMLEAQANDYNNPYMYIQNVLLPSVAMAGLLDLSHAPPPSKQ